MPRVTKAEIEAAIKALDHMENMSSRLSKETVLEQEKDNQLLRTIVLMALGGDMYHVHPTANLVPAVTVPDEREAWDKFVRLAKALTSREMTGQTASMATDRLLVSVPKHLAKWFRRILNHDLRIGVSKKTITKIWGKDFWRSTEEKDRGWSFNGCLLAKKYEDVYKGSKRPRFPLAVEPKLDGERALVFAFPAEQRIHIYTRGNKRREHIEQVAEFSSQLCDIARALNRITKTREDKPVFLDGEFLAVDGSWNRTSSLIRSTKNFNKRDFLKEVRCVLFDWSWLPNYMRGSFDVAWSRRKRALLSTVANWQKAKRVAKFSSNVWILAHRMVLDVDEMQAYYDWCLDQSFEGIMVKDPKAPHVFKRTDLCLKLKPEDDVTGTIVDAVAGKGKHAGASKADVKKVRAIMEEWGSVEDDGSYLHCSVDRPRALSAELREAISDATDRRISTHRKGHCSYRYGERLGYFVVKYKGRQFHVGGGFAHASDNDQRMTYWQKRKDIVGMKVDFRVQGDKTEVAIGRFNRFIRLREDLT